MSWLNGILDVLEHNGIKMRLYITLWLLLIRVCTLKHTHTHKQLKRTVHSCIFFSLFTSSRIALYIVFFPLILSEREFSWLVRYCTVYVFGIKVEKKVWW